MSHFNNVLTTFLSIKRGSCIAFYLICVPKINKGLMGLEWHEGEENP